MRSLYFNANLNGLIEFLKQYNTEENIYNFITTLDFLNKHMLDKKLTTYSSEIREYAFKNIFIFLIQTYIKKIFLEHPSEEIDEVELTNKINILFKKIYTRISDKKGKTIVKLDSDFAVRIAQEALSSYNFTMGKKIVSEKKK